MSEKWFRLVLAWAMGVGSAGIIAIAASCAPSATNASQTINEDWHKGPGGTRWIDIGDGTRCYQYTFDTLFCIRMQP